MNEWQRRYDYCKSTPDDEWGEALTIDALIGLSLFRLDIIDESTELYGNSPYIQVKKTVWDYCVGRFKQGLES